MPNQFLSPEGDLETFNYFVTEYWLIDQYVGDTLWVWGQNNTGPLGDNTTTSRSVPVTTFAGGTNWKQVSSGGYHTVAIKTDGTLWTWGTNSYGQLGDNTTTSRSTPVTTFAGGTNWKQVTGGYRHTAAIKTDGTLWIWGSGQHGRLGNNSTTNTPTPITTFAGGTNWKQVVGKRNSTYAIKIDGTLWTWGFSSPGSLGNNDAVTDRSTPVTTFAGGTNWKQIAEGRGNGGAAIKTDGTLWTWGQNNFGQLGDNTATQKNTPVTTFAGGTNWKQVTCNGYTTSAIKTDGTLWTWGRNLFSQIGDNTNIARSTPVTTSVGGTNWKQVSCGDRHTAAIKTDGTLWTWGLNSSAQLAINAATIVVSTPVTTFAGGTNWKRVSCGDRHTPAVTSGTDPTFFIA